MSRYTATQITITPRLTLSERWEQTLRQQGPIENWVSSHELVQVQRRVTAARTDGEIAEILKSNRNVGHALLAKNPKLVHSNKDLSPQAAIDALSRTVASVRRDERTLVSAGIADALNATGWSTDLRSNDIITALCGRRGHEVVLFEIRDGGATEIDFAGASDNSCEQSLAEISDAAQKAGLSMDIRRAQIHNSPEGGTLFARAADQNTEDPVAGLLRGTDPEVVRKHGDSETDRRRAQRRRNAQKGRNRG